MFRNFDSWDVYFDRDGKRLSGCVEFMLKDGTTPAAIYDGDDTPLNNPVLTDDMGRTEHQVFVRSDVLAYFYRYVGNGSLADEQEEGIDTSDVSKWALQYTVESAAIDERSVTGESSMGVGTMADLRALDPTEVPEVYETKIVCLQGYYECGDCEPVWYVYDPDDGASNDDNGSVIQPDNVLTGRWILVRPTKHCDSRHFGVFPQDSEYAQVDHTTGISQLVSYCNAKGLRPFFNGSQETPYFIYSSLSVSSKNPIDVSDETQFVDGGTNNRFYGEWNGNPFFSHNNTNLRCRTVKLSWNARSWQDCVDFVIDSAFRPEVLSNVNVIFAVAPASNLHLTNCTVESLHKIDKAIVMADMEIEESWFIEGYDWGQLSISGCEIRLCNFSSAVTYVTLKNKQNDPLYGSLDEQDISGVTLLTGAVAENFSGSVTLAGDAELHNATANITCTGATPNLNAIDCWLTLVSASQPFDYIAIRRGSIDGADVRVLTSAIFDDVAISSKVEVLGGSLKCHSCVINQNISHVGNPIVEDVQDCTFNAQIQIRGGATDSIVNAVWVRNVGTVANPISLDRTNLASLDTSHTYKYADNSGTFLQTTTTTFTFDPLNYVPGTPNELSGLTWNMQGGNLYAYTVTVDDGTGTYVDDPTKYVCKVHLFSVGTTAVRKWISFSPSNSPVLHGGSSVHATGGTIYAMSFNHVLNPSQESFVSTLLHDTGYTWKLRDFVLPAVGLADPGSQITVVFRELQ